MSSLTAKLTRANLGSEEEQCGSNKSFFRGPTSTSKLWSLSYQLCVSVSSGPYPKIKGKLSKWVVLKDLGSMHHYVFSQRKHVVINCLVAQTVYETLAQQVEKIQEQNRKGKKKRENPEGNRIRRKTAQRNEKKRKETKSQRIKRQDTKPRSMWASTQ